MSWFAEPVSVPTWLICVVAGLGVLGWVYLMHAQRRDSMGVTVEDAPPLAESLHAIAGAASGTLHPGNAVTALQNGAFFDALARDVESATRSVHLETYIWGDGDVVARFGSLLSDRARKGVRVRLVIDAMGSLAAKREKLEELRAAGVTVARFRPIGRRFLHAQNYRDHRKIAVIDGRVGFVMGHGFADEWLGRGEDAEHWRDTGLRIEGPAVHDLQAAFTQSWTEAGREVIVEAAAWPVLEERGSALVHVTRSSAGDVASTVELLYQHAMACAREEILIANPYFAPEPDFTRVLAKAARRGVRTQLLLPGKMTDSRIVRHAGHACFEALLRAGVRIHEHAETFPHQKVMVVDGAWSCVGSTNMDLHSLEMSEEVSVGVFDRALAGDLRRAFLDDAARSREITLEDWRRRNILHRVGDRLFYSLRGQL